MKGIARPHLNKLIYKLIIGCQCQQEMGNFTDSSEWFATPKMDCMCAKLFKDKEFYQL